MSKKKKEVCEHCFSPVSHITDLYVYGTGEEKALRLDSVYIIMRCGDCGLEGWCFGSDIE